LAELSWEGTSTAVWRSVMAARRARLSRCTTRVAAMASMRALRAGVMLLTCWRDRSSAYEKRAAASRSPVLACSRVGASALSRAADTISMCCSTACRASSKGVVTGGPGGCGPV